MFKENIYVDISNTISEFKEILQMRLFEIGCNWHDNCKQIKSISDGLWLQIKRNEISYTYNKPIGKELTVKQLLRHIDKIRLQQYKESQKSDNSLEEIQTLKDELLKLYLLKDLKNTLTSD